MGKPLSADQTEAQATLAQLILSAGLQGGYPIKNRTFPLDSRVELVVGKQTRAFALPSAAAAPQECCFSILGEGLILNLQAPDADTRSRWLFQFHQVMTGHSQRVPR